MPYGYGASKNHSSNKSTTTGGGNTNRERGIQRNATQKVSKKTKTGGEDHRTTRNSQTHFINTSLPPMEQKTLAGKLLQGFANSLDSVTGASVKNRAFFDKNYERIRANKTNIGLPDKATFDALPLSEKQALYRATRLDIMRNNQNPLGEPLGDGGGANQTLLSQEPKSGVVTSDGIVGPIIGSNAVKTPEEIQAEKNKEGGIILAKKIGRSRMIKTSAQGLTDDEDIITRKQLLG